MKAKTLIAGIVTLAVAFLVPACSRNDVEEPGPTGPSTFAIVLKVTAGSNTILAGQSRGSSVINATLKKYDGSALANRTIFFELVKQDLTTKEELGYLEETGVVTQTKTTDSGGNVSAVYYGPTADEMKGLGVDDTSVYVKLTCALENNNFVSDYAQIDIVSENGPVNASVEATAYPNALHAGAQREASQVFVKLTGSNAEPLAGMKLLFEIYSADQSANLNLGYFTGHAAVIQALTDAGGLASVTYYGPTALELIQRGFSADTTVNLKINITGIEDSEGKPYSEFLPINIVYDSPTPILVVAAYPNSVHAGAQRETTAIRVQLKDSNSLPLAGKKLIFEIFGADETAKSTLGHFSGNLAVVEKRTDTGGQAEVTYFGPTDDEIAGAGLTGDTAVNIKVTATGYQDTEGNPVSEFAPVNIVSDTSYIVIASANPGTILAGDSRGKTTIQASFRKRDGSPLSGKKLYFQIFADTEGTTKSDFGYFEGNTTVKTVTTDSGGNAKVVYFGPTSAEIEYFDPPATAEGEDPANPDNQTVYIRVTPAVERPNDDDSISVNAKVDIICEPIKYIVELRAYPAVLLAGSTRPSSSIVMTVKRNGKAVKGKTAYFLVQSPALGYFKDTKTVQSQDVLDANGQAQVVYLGPLAVEMGQNDVGVIIEGRFVIDTQQPPDDGQGPPQYKRNVYLHVVRKR